MASAVGLYSRMGLVRWRTTKTKLKRPEGAEKEAILLLHHDIVSKVEKIHFLKSMIITL